MSKIGDNCSKPGAERIAKHLMKRWKAKGHPNVKAWVEPVPGFPDFWQVRTNLINGLPPKVEAKMVDGCYFLNKTERKGGDPNGSKETKGR